MLAAILQIARLTKLAGVGAGRDLIECKIIRVLMPRGNRFDGSATRSSVPKEGGCAPPLFHCCAEPQRDAERPRAARNTRAPNDRAMPASRDPKYLECAARRPRVQPQPERLRRHIAPH